jgi:hypothetical protein
MTQTVNALNLKNIVDDFRLLADRHKQINSYGFGDLDEFTYQVDRRDKQENRSVQAPYFPYLYVIPANVQVSINFDTAYNSNPTMDGGGFLIKNLVGNTRIYTRYAAMQMFKGRYNV